jgi:hypothetical protein
MKKLAFAAMAACAIVAPTGLGATTLPSVLECYGPTCFLTSCTIKSPETGGTSCTTVTFPNPEFPQAPAPE